MNVNIKVSRNANKKAGKYIKFTDKQKEMFNNLKASGLPVKIIIVNSDSNFEVEYDIVTYNKTEIKLKNGGYI